MTPKLPVFVWLAVICLLPITGEAKSKPDPLSNVYSELKVGMTLSQVRDMAEKYYPNCRLQDTDIWGPHEFLDHPGDPFLSWVLGIDGKPIRTESGELSQLHRIFLRMDFDKNLKLLNAVYVRSNKKDFKDIKAGTDKFAMRIEERKALVGDGYYK